MKILLNPKYEALHDYLTHIEEHFERDGKEIHRGRNVLRTLRVDGLTLCVKRYGQLPLRSRLATKIYKTPKGKKAYFRPLELRERGFESPEPVAFVNYRKGWTKTTTYFVCLHSDYRFSLASLPTLDKAVREAVTDSFARYAARLHEEGFLHRDFSPANILFDNVNGRYRFALIDTNSVRTGRPVSVAKGCANFARLVGDDEFLARLAREYADARKADAAQCEQLIRAART